MNLNSITCSEAKSLLTNHLSILHELSVGAEDKDTKIIINSLHNLLINIKGISNQHQRVDRQDDMVSVNRVLISQYVKLIAYVIGLVDDKYSALLLKNVIDVRLELKKLEIGDEKKE